MKIVFFGLGSIGQRHAKILLNDYNHEIYAFRTNKGQSNHNLPLNEIYSWSEVVDLRPDVAFITNPTSLHIRTALKCAKNGNRLFIEKPIDSKTRGLSELIRIVEEKQLTTYVAYNLRFHPVILKIKEYFRDNKFLHMRVVCTSFLPDWRPGQDYKKSYSSINAMGGGVLLDLSHELDYSNYLLCGFDELIGNFGRESDITVDSEDYADILIKSPIGYGNIHINFLSHHTKRKIYIDFDVFSVVGDLINNSIIEYKNNEIIYEKNYNIESDDLYRKQLKYFFSNIDNPGMQNNIREASDLFNKIIDFRDRMNYG